MQIRRNFIRRKDIRKIYLENIKFGLFWRSILACAYKLRNMGDQGKMVYVYHFFGEINKRLIWNSIFPRSSPFARVDSRWTIFLRQMCVVFQRCILLCMSKITFFSHNMEGYCEEFFNYWRYSLKYLQDLSTAEPLHDEGRGARLILHVSIYQEGGELTVLYCRYRYTKTGKRTHYQSTEHVHQLGECCESKLRKLIFFSIIIIIIIKVYRICNTWSLHL